MKKIFRARNVFLALTVSLVVWIVQFVYRTNNFCGPGDHPIQSEADAIAVAKTKMVKNPFFSSERFGSAPDFVDALERAENCCNAIRSRNMLGSIFWDVYLGASISTTPNTGIYWRASRSAQSHTALVAMSNCGVISTSDSYKDADY
ncbi:hypothetical protein [Bradyrhizobium sp. RDI18]|uniref:hypothetical protein n=1 Tax=Bradyrhizobium sp. RDI18 TaxID=3367400 RepID=UPI00371B6975